jgi:hypothetical protein
MSSVCEYDVFFYLPNYIGKFEQFSIRKWIVMFQHLHME